jgi:hypothetical protein
LVFEEAAFAISRDIGDTSVGLLMQQPYNAKDVVVAFRPAEAETDEPWFFLGTCRRNKAIGGGFWVLGVELREFLNDTHSIKIDGLLPFTEQLIPQDATPAGV